MAFDYKKEYKEFYLPPKKPGIVTVPPLNYIAVRGEGDPNAEDGAYQRAISMLYTVAYSVKMSKKGGPEIEGYFDFVVPPLEGFWWQEGTDSADLGRKEDFRWISLIRLPDFVGEEDFKTVVAAAERKKKMDLSEVEFLRFDEGLCVQCMHLGAYDDEPATIEAMRRFAEDAGFVFDLGAGRFHHEIYLSDARRVPPEKRKTVIRYPIRKKA
ncbi:MAG: GyrI-like domain-containing protein [Bacillota bacterium]|jgi:hypothetical protein